MYLTEATRIGADRSHDAARVSTVARPAKSGSGVGSIRNENISAIDVGVSDDRARKGTVGRARVATGVGGTVGGT